MIIRSSARQAVTSAHGDHIYKELLLKGGIVPGLTQVAVSTIAPASDIETHHHPTMWEFFFVLSGEATYVLDGEEFQVGPGDLFVVPPGGRHSQKIQSESHRVLHWGLATD
jgi:quercetin dioxygenase-like cupin family protein